MNQYLDRDNNMTHLDIFTVRTSHHRMHFIQESVKRFIISVIVRTSSSSKVNVGISHGSTYANCIMPLGRSGRGYIGIYLCLFRTLHIFV